MAFKLPTMSRETSSSTSTGDMVMAGAQSGYFAFSAGLSNGDTTFLTFKMGSDTEEGLYTYNSGANSFTRTQIYRSTNANAAVSWAAGTKDVICGLVGPSNLDTAGLALFTGVLNIWAPPQGRLTLASLTAIMTTSQSSQTTVYYTAYVGSLVPLFDGTNFGMHDVGQQLSQLTTDTTKSPAAVAANKNYDIFIWNDSGTYRATRGPAWSSDTSRGSGAGTSELSDLSVAGLHHGINLNANAITNGPAAFRGTYVGTIRSDGSSQINWTLGSSAAGGGAAVLGVWNAFNRVYTATKVTDSTAGYTYSSTTARASNASNSNRVSFVTGFAIDAIEVSYSELIQTAATTSSIGVVGCALDATNSMDIRAASSTSAAVAILGTCANNNKYAPQVGFHFIQKTELSGDGTTITFNLNTSYNALQLGLLM